MSFVVHTEKVILDGAEAVPKEASIVREAELLLQLGIPNIVILFGSTIPPFLTASYIGRNFGYVYLDGFSLANLTCNLFTLSLLQGLYSASDTLSPQAFGVGNKREVGLLAIRGFAASIITVAPISIILLFTMQSILEAVGEEREASKHATEWYRIYTIFLPFYALYQVTWKFLSAQHVMIPLVITSSISCVVIQPILLQLFGRLLGFQGSAIAMVLTYVFQSLGLIFWLWWKKPHISGTWPGLVAWRDALEWGPFREFLVLGLGGMLASSEWIYWETLSLIVGTFGNVPLSVHTIPTQVITVSFMISLGIGIALAVRLGVTLPRNVARAKELVFGCFVAGVILFGIMSIVMYTERRRIVRIFTNEADVLEGAEEIWGNVCFYFFNLCIFGINIGIATGLGMQWELGIITLLALWVFGLPAAYYFAVVRGGGLVAAWWMVWPPYIVMNGSLMIAFLMKDWDKLAALIRLREAIEDGDLESLLLKPTSEKAKPTYGATCTKS